MTHHLGHCEEPPIREVRAARRVARTTTAATRVVMEPDSLPDGSEGVQRTDADRQIRGSSLLLVGRLIAIGLDLMTQVLIVRSLSKGDFGAFAFALSIVSLLATISVFGLDKTLPRFATIYEEKRDQGGLVGSIALGGDDRRRSGDRRRSRRHRDRNGDGPGTRRERCRPRPAVDPVFVSLTSTSIFALPFPSAPHTNPSTVNRWSPTA